MWGVKKEENLSYWINQYKIIINQKIVTISFKILALKFFAFKHQYQWDMRLNIYKLIIIENNNWIFIFTFFCSKKSCEYILIY